MLGFHCNPPNHYDSEYNICTHAHKAELLKVQPPRALPAKNLLLRIKTVYRSLNPIVLKLSGYLSLALISCEVGVTIPWIALLSRGTGACLHLSVWELPRIGARIQHKCWVLALLPASSPTHCLPSLNPECLLP